MGNRDLGGGRRGEQQARVLLVLGRYRATCGFEMCLDDFACGLFALPAAVRNWQSRLYFVQRVGAAVNALADLPVADPIAQADVHQSFRRELMGGSKYKCE